MPFSLDPVQVLAEAAKEQKKRKEMQMGLGDFELFSSDNARSYGSNFGDQMGGIRAALGGGYPGSDGSGMEAGLGGALGNLDMEMDMASSAIGAMGDMEAAKIQAEMAAKQASKNRSANRTNSIIGAVGVAGGAAVGALI